MRVARDVANDAYERGWREGWAAALSRVEERGLDAVRQTERDQCQPVPMVLTIERPKKAR